MRLMPVNARGCDTARGCPDIPRPGWEVAGRQPSPARVPLPAAGALGAAPADTATPAAGDAAALSPPAVWGGAPGGPSARASLGRRAAPQGGLPAAGGRPNAHPRPPIAAA